MLSRDTNQLPPWRTRALQITSPTHYPFITAWFRTAPYGILNEDVSHRLIYISVCSPLDGTVWEGFGGVAEACQPGWVLRFQKPTPFLVVKHFKLPTVVVHAFNPSTRARGRQLSVSLKPPSLHSDFRTARATQWDHVSNKQNKQNPKHLELVDGM